MKSLILTVCAFFQAYLLFPLSAKAAVEVGLNGANTALTSVGTSVSGANQSSLPTILGRIISVLLGFLGVLFIGLVVYAGFLYLTDQGAGENVKKAKKLLTTSIIGLVIVVAAYAIATYVIGAMTAVGAV